MKYMFLEFSDDRWYHSSIKKKSKTRNYPLEDLFQFLDDKESFWVHATENENDLRKVMVWSDWYLKKNLMPKDLNSYDDFIAYVDRYHMYTNKRLKEMPAIRIFKDNLEFLQQQWQEICKRKPKYVIFREHDNGFVDILEKDELSPEDIANMEREHKIYLNYLKRWHAYLAAHPQRSTIWRSSADDEYESDFALYDPADEQGIDE